MYLLHDDGIIPADTEYIIKQRIQIISHSNESIQLHRPTRWAVTLANFNEKIWNMQFGGCRLQFPLRKTQRSGFVNVIPSNKASEKHNVLSEINLKNFSGEWP